MREDNALERLHGRNERRGPTKESGDDCEAPLCETHAVELCCDFLKSRKRRLAEGNASTADETSFPCYMSSSAFAAPN